MTDGFSSGFANSILGMLSGATPSIYTSLYLQLHTGAPGPSGTANISAGSTVRMMASFGTASDGTITLPGGATWSNSGAVSETITDISIWSASAGGTFVLSANLSNPKSWSGGGTIQLSSLSVSIPTST